MLQNTLFDDFLNHLSEGKQYKNYLKTGIKQYDILKYKVVDIPIHQIKRMYSKIIQSYKDKEIIDNQQQIDSDQPCWMINQLKIFVWTAICYAGYYHQRLNCLNEEGWAFLISVFYFKPLEILQFQILSLLKGDAIRTPKKWSKAQDQLLKTILRNIELQGKWNQISKQFFIKSGKNFFRKPQKCRQHWFNHLNPVISHDRWSLEQDLELIQYVKSKGKRWAQISIFLGGKRTQHMVKNRYKSLQKKYELEISKSQEKFLNASIILQRLQLTDQKEQELKLKKIESSSTSKTTNEVDLSKVSFQTNIDGLLMEQQNQPEIKSNQKSESEIEQNLLQVNQQFFFTNSNVSENIFNQLDFDMEKYVESFLC